MSKARCSISQACRNSLPLHPPESPKEKKPHATDKRKEVYTLTEKGLDLIPILLELANWSAQHDLQTGAPQVWIAMVNEDKEKMIRHIRETVQRGGSIFVGPDSVVSTLGVENE